MAFSLNAISDTDAAEYLRSYEAEIQRLEDRGPDMEQRRVPSAAPRYYEKLSQLYFKAGALCHRQGRPPRHLVHYFRLAGERAVEELELRTQPTTSTNRNFYDLIERVMGCVVGFCDPSWRARLVALPEWSYHWPHDPKWEFMPGSREQPRMQTGYYRMAYLRQCLEYLAKGTFNVPMIQAFIRELENDPGTKDDRNEASQCLWALMGLADHNPGFFDQTLSRLCELHTGLASSGRYQSACEGLVFMNGVFLRALAFGQNMQVGVFSPYLPTG